MVFSHVIRGRPGGLFQLSGGGAVRRSLQHNLTRDRMTVTITTRLQPWQLPGAREDNSQISPNEYIIFMPQMSVMVKVIQP